MASTTVETGGILIVGYGNTLRGDDGLGPYVAAEIAKRTLPGVRTKTLFQLTPELAEELSRAHTAIFVDASTEPAAEVKVATINENDVFNGFAHTANIEAILSLARTVFGQAPSAWVVSVPGSDFSFRAELSSAAREHARRAIETVVELASCARVHNSQAQCNPFGL